MKRILSHNRQDVNVILNTAEKRQYFSPATYADYQITKPLIEKYLKGKLLDIGCGHMPFKSLISKHVTQYETFDVDARTDGVTYIGDIQNMYQVADDSYDSVVCFEVLEHIPDPFKAAQEIHRVLKRNGILLLSVPHLSRLHEIPYDYYRYTKYGLKSVLERHGFEVLETHERGGLFCFLGHTWSTFWVCLFWGVPILGAITFFLNKWLCVKFCYWLDSLWDKEKLFALGYSVAARKI